MDFLTHKDVLWRAVMFRDAQYKDPDAHSKKMAKRFGKPVWDAFCEAADLTLGKGSCLAVWQDMADEVACKKLGLTTLQEQRNESFEKMKRDFSFNPI